MNSSIICDYVTLFVDDADENGLSDFAKRLFILKTGAVFV